MTFAKDADKFKVMRVMRFLLVFFFFLFLKKREKKTEMGEGEKGRKKNKINWFDPVWESEGEWTMPRSVEGPKMEI